MKTQENKRNVKKHKFINKNNKVNKNKRKTEKELNFYYDFV